MAWDDDKGPGDGLPSSEWDAHVADQKSNKTIVQSSQPPVGPEGQTWAEIIEVFSETLQIASYGRPLKALGVDTAGLKIWYNDNNSSIYQYDIPSDSVEWSYTTSSGIADVDANSSSVFIPLDNGDVVSLSRTNGSLNWSNPSGLGTAYAVTANSNAVYVGGDTIPSVVEMALSDGTVGFTYGTSAYVDDIDDDGSNIYFTQNASTTVESIDSTGTQNWSVTLSSNGEKIEYNQNSGNVNITANAPEVYSYTTAGSQNWVTPLSGVTGYGVFYDDSNGDVLTLSGEFDTDDYVTRLASSDGSVITELTVTDWVEPNDVVFISGDYYITYRDAVNTSNGNVGRYGLSDEYTKYISNGNIWMKEST